ncbi:DUF397 domain-containing protein [Streptomyces aurantiacus]|uniref:DUF397 domain-containing protein n=1 Tax=Streptomyces aurantiacus TaxID=47760 RepID=A0A7G1P4K2_9ACTN|nr:DUF397 domain-containing protein [Streptomyces aurantiacus]BCL28774.1 hypothetical protein GCM10017557_36330 [Streptomyces aurantiacus]
MNSPDLTDANWFKSTYSSGQGACIEAAALPNAIATRDSKDANSPILLFTRDGWRYFIGAVNRREFRD